MQRFEWTPRKVFMLPSARAISRATMPAAFRLMPGQPYPWMMVPMMPSSDRGASSS